MISEEVLDEILPVPALEELKDKTVEELKKEGFVITKFHSGGVFHMLLMIALRIRTELLELLRYVLNNMLVTHAEGIWLELLGAGFSKKRKKAVKTGGAVMLSRKKDGNAVKIPKGYVFKTIKDINGEELRFFAVKDTVLQQGQLSVKAEVEAEKEGTRYNVPAGQISRSLVFLEGIDRIENTSGWIAREGADVEDYESFRERILGSWAELSTLPTRDKYKSVCESVPGVLFVAVNDKHPRGQGTVDIIVTGTAGEATQGLLDTVREAAESIRGPYDNLLVKSSVTVTQDISVQVTVPLEADADGLDARVAAAIAQLLRIRRERELNVLLHVDISHEIKSKFPVRNVKVTLPESDLLLEEGKVIVAGTISVSVGRV